MSSILEALRKLENERARRRENAPEIATSILRGHGRRRPGFPLWGWLLAGVILLALAGLWFRWPRPAVPPSASSPPGTAATVSPPSAAPLPGRELVLEEVLDTRIPPSPVAPVPVRPVLSPVTAVTATAADTPVPPPVPTARDKEEETLAVSAIVFQDDATARMAVVNDLPVMIGEEIGTARVVDIQADRVIFSRDGTTFSIMPH